MQNAREAYAAAAFLVSCSAVSVSDVKLKFI